MTILDEIEAETWHALVAIYTHQRFMETLAASATRFDLANQLVAMHALMEMIVIRISRLADKREDARSVSMLLKRGSFQAPRVAVEEAANRFISLAGPVLKIRHEQIAHMKPGVLSSLEPRSLPTEALRATEALVELVDIARDQPLSYTYKIGSKEPAIDLKASLIVGEMVTT